MCKYDPTAFPPPHSFPPLSPLIETFALILYAMFRLGRAIYSRARLPMQDVFATSEKLQEFDLEYVKQLKRAVDFRWNCAMLQKWQHRLKPFLACLSPKRAKSRVVWRKPAGWRAISFWTGSATLSSKPSLVQRCWKSTGRTSNG